MVFESIVCIRQGEIGLQSNKPLHSFARGFCSDSPNIQRPYLRGRFKTPCYQVSGGPLMHQPHAARSFPVFLANYGYS